jgi:hypothetical protein
MIGGYLAATLNALTITAVVGAAYFRHFEFSDGQNELPEGQFDLGNGGLVGVKLGAGN